MQKEQGLHEMAAIKIPTDGGGGEGSGISILERNKEPTGRQRASIAELWMFPLYIKIF